MSGQNIRSRYIGGCYAGADDGESPQVDLSTLALRLLLFDTYIFESNKLKEFRSLVRAFGYGGVRAMLSSGVFRVHCEALAVGQTGQTGLGFRGKKRDGSPKAILPMNSYSFDVIMHAEKQKIMHENMQCIHDIEGLRYKEAKKLKRLIADNLVSFPSDSVRKILDQLLYDFRIKTPNIRRAVLSRVAQKLPNYGGQDDFSFNIEVDEENDVHVTTDLARVFGFDAQSVHEIFGNALLAIGGLNKRIEMMRAFAALTGFRENELAIFEDKVSFITSAISPEAIEERLRRIVSWPQFPDLNEAIRDKKLSMETLLKVRDTTECKEFREWLWASDSLAVEQLKERLESLSSRLSIKVSSGTARAIRWLTATAVGLIPEYGIGAGPALGLLDTFLVDKLLRTSGVLTFLGRQYPSVFKGT